MDEELLVPFAECKVCEKSVPVLFREFDFDKNTIVEVIVCPICFDILNMAEDVHLEYFGLDEVEGLGYKVVEEEED